MIKDLVEGDNNLSRIYVFILYTNSNPYIVKVLRDNYFRKSLDSISGSNWPIFALRPLQQGQMKDRYGNPSHIGIMPHTWNESSDNISILMDFGLKDSKELPLFAVLCPIYL